MPDLYIQWYLFSYLLSHVAKEEGNCKFIAIQSWQWCHYSIANLVRSWKTRVAHLLQKGRGATFYDLYIFGQFCHLRQLQRILDRILPVSSELTRKIWNKVKSMCPVVTLSIFIDVASCYLVCLYLVSGGSTQKNFGRAPHSRPNRLHFHAVFTKICTHPHPFGVASFLVNPGSAAVHRNEYQIGIGFRCTRLKHPIYSLTLLTLWARIP